MANKTKRFILIVLIIYTLISDIDMKKDKKKKKEGNDAPAQRRAIAEIKGLIVEGNVTFTQEGNGPVHIVGTISGLHEGSYGFHVHEKGDTVGGDCMRTGSHFNPHMANHGEPSSSVSRHVGDLGNIKFDEEQVAHIDFTDSVISLFGENSIIGRGLVVHEGTDDFGRGGASDSLTTGHAGKRAGCGVIGIM